MDINWSDTKCEITPHFCVKDAVWLPRYNRLATPADGLTLEKQANLIMLLHQMEVVRAFLGDKPINGHVTYRPKEYNVLVGGAKNSAHIYGMAMDFNVIGMSCDDARKLIVPKLTVWRMRCEDVPGSTWVHLDQRTPTNNDDARRFFKPEHI